ncbi:MAG: PcfB family protein [Gemmiger sp.]
MNYGAEPADQVVRYSLEGTEVALRISGSAAVTFAKFVAAVLQDQKKTHGKTRLVRLLREGKPLKFFSVEKDRMREFAHEAKMHGLLFVPMRDKTDPDHIEIAILADDASKVNRIFDRLQLDVVGLRSVGPQLSVNETGERSKEGPSGAFHHPSGFALQTGGLAGRQAVDTGMAEAVDEVAQDMEAVPAEAPDTLQKEPQKEDEPAVFPFPARRQTEPEPVPPSMPSSNSNEKSPPMWPGYRADQVRARGRRASVRLELGEIRAILAASKENSPMPKSPIRIHRGSPVRG